MVLANTHMHLLAFVANAPFSFACNVRRCSAESQQVFQAINRFVCIDGDHHIAIFWELS